MEVEILALAARWLTGKQCKQNENCQNFYKSLQLQVWKVCLVASFLPRGLTTDERVCSLMLA